MIIKSPGRIFNDMAAVYDSATKGFPLCTLLNFILNTQYADARLEEIKNRKTLDLKVKVGKRWRILKAEVRTNPAPDYDAGEDDIEFFLKTRHIAE